MILDTVLFIISNLLMKRLTFIIVFFLITISLFSQKTGRYIIKTKQDLSSKRLHHILQLDRADEIEPIFKELNLYLAKIKPEEKEKIERNSIIDFIVKDSKLEYRNTPNDPNYIKQYAPAVIRAEEVWDFNTGGINGQGDTIVVAVLDKGMETTHRELIDNIWKNNDEIPGDSIDNDGNGYIDDYFGVDMRNKNDNHYLHSHGTAVAGIIGAKGNNNNGMAGINWNIKILPITNVIYVSDVIGGYHYVYSLRKKFNETGGTHGAFVVATNLSAGKSEEFPNDSPENKDWCDIYNLLGQQGILNVASASNDTINVEEKGDMPTLCTSDYFISVTSTDEDDNFDTDRSYGSTSIDLAAPGKDVYTLYSDNGYKEKFTGTSAAAPHVAGAIGLLYTIPCSGFTSKVKANPAELSLKIKDYILDYTDKHADLTDKTVSGGRLDIYNTYIHLVEDLCDDITTGTFDIKKIYPNPARNNVFIEYSTDNFNLHTLIMYNSIGQKVYEKSFRPKFSEQKTEKIDVSHFSSGIYFIKLISGDNSIVKAISII